MQESIIGTLRGTIKDSVSILEAKVISTKPLQLQSVMDSALIIQESNMYPIDEQFQDNNAIKTGEIFVVLQIDNGETCKYLLLSREG